MRLGQDFAERAQARHDAHDVGLLVEDGLLTGVGDSPADRARSVLAMRKAGEQQVRVMTLVPQPQTPLAEVPVPDTWNEVLTIAVMRLLMPDRLIPASLDVEGIEGLCSRIDAGANVVTSLVPPRSGLCGVAHAEYEVDDGLRTVAEARPRLAELGLRQGTRQRSLRPGWRQPTPTTAARTGDDGAPVRGFRRRGRQAAGHRGRLPRTQGRLPRRARRPPAGCAVPPSGLAAEAHVFDVCEGRSSHTATLHGL